jgi:hypothetical protein
MYIYETHPHILSPSSLSLTLPPTNTPIHCTYFYSLVFHFWFQIQCSKGFLNVFWLWIYLILVNSSPSVTLLYPFPPNLHYSTPFSTYCYIFYLQRYKDLYCFNGRDVNISLCGFFFVVVAICTLKNFCSVHLPISLFVFFFFFL